ncbi:MAG: hypothetical protein ACE5OS_06100 [Anaerolineae bacterium]
MSLHLRTRVDKGAVVLAIIFLAAFPLLFKPWIHGFDTVAYYSWLRSTVIDGNLDVGDEFAHYGYDAERGSTHTGYTYNEWAVGSAVLWSPFFLAAHGLSHLAHVLGLPVATDGYAAQYVWAISLASAMYAFIAVLLTYHLCREFFALPISVLATAAVWLSSSLVFYMYSHPAMSHANDAFTYALFVFTWCKTRHQQWWHSAALRGAATGLCALVRQMNAVFICFALGEFVASGVQAWLRTRQTIEMRQTFLKVATFSLAWWLVYSPQVIVWRIVFGHWIEVNPYAGGAGVGFDWLHPHLLSVLLSSDHGLFVWTPLMLPAILGWLPFWRKDRRLTALLVLNFVLQLYVIASWGDWSGSVAFGQRFFTNMIPSFALGLAALLNVLQQRVRFRWLVTVCALFVIWNGLLIVRYVLEDIPRRGSMPLGHFIIGQFTVIPRHISRILQALITRE